MILLFDVGNTHTHLGLADSKAVRRHADMRTSDWFNGKSLPWVRKFVGRSSLEGAALCSVVPRATRQVRQFLRGLPLPFVELTPATTRGIGIVYPKPETIGPDRLANAMAVKHHFGAPSVVVDFGTAVTFDVVSREGNYVGGIIAPGLAAMTEYLHEKTALLPRIQIRDVSACIGTNTEEAMLIGAVHGYRGLVRELIQKLRRELGSRRLPVVATGGYAELIAKGLPEITAVEPALTLEGLRLAFAAR